MEKLVELDSSVYENKGFSLIEIMLVVGILIALSAIVLFNLGSFRGSQDLKLETNKIVNILRDAENRSMSQELGMQWAVGFENPTDNQPYYYLYSIAASGATSSDTIVFLSRSVKFDTPVTGSGLDVVFAPITGLPASAATVKISAKNNPLVSSTISVNPNGRINY